MTAKSFWFQTGVSGDGSSPYTEVDHSRWVRVVGACAGHEGIGANYGFEFDAQANPTGGSDRKVRIKTGGAIVDGKPLDQDVTEDMLLDTTPSYRRDRIVLKADWSARTVRIAVLKGTDGSETPPTIPSPVPGTTVYLALWQVRIVSSGAVTLSADERVWAVPQVDDATIDIILGILGVKDGGIDAIALATDAVETTKIKALNVTAAKLAADAVETAKIKNLNVTSGKLAADAVIAGKIADGAVDQTAALANNIVDDTKVGNRVPQLYRRQGGHATQWGTSGDTTYTPTAIRIQCGTVLATTPVIKTVTFPVAFSATPVVILTPRAGNKIAYVTNLAAGSFGCGLTDAGGSTLVGGDVSWMAIGPE